MVRERLRGMADRTWIHHAVAAGPELLLASLTGLLMPYFILVGIPGIQMGHPLGSVPFPIILMVATLGLAGAVTWLYGWWAEKCRGVAGSLKWDRFGATMLALCWAAASVVIWLASDLPWTNGVVTLFLSAGIYTRVLATKILDERAQVAEVLVQKADRLMDEGGDHAGG